MASIVERARRSWDIFRGRDPTDIYRPIGIGNSLRPDRPMFTKSNMRSMVTAIYNQISVDCSSIDVKHVKLNEENKFDSEINDYLNRVLTEDANIDQTGRALIQDVVITMLDEGAAALVPVETTVDPMTTDSYEVIEARVGRIVQWFPQHVRVSFYNAKYGDRQEMVLPKRIVPIVLNPFYATMNEPNSTAKRLTRVLNQLDRSNEYLSSNKLDLIIQLPFQIRTPAKKKLAEERRKDITAQLTGSEYGIAYADATEKVVQLNRSLENNLWTQAKELQADLYNQLGFSDSIFNGTADEQTMLNYYNRSIEPIMTAIIEEIQRKWISRTARSQMQGIRFFRDPFKLVPVGQLAEFADKFTRNEILTSNEIRSIIGLKPSKDPRADKLINSNLNQAEADPRVSPGSETPNNFQNEEKKGE